jgi:hypothetical protein
VFSSAGPVTRPLGTPPLDAEGVVLGAEGLVDVEGVVELGCCTVFGLDGLTVGDCVGVVGAGPAGAADPADPGDPADPAEPPDEDDCACACSIRDQSPNVAPPDTSNSASAIRSKLLADIAVSFDPGSTPFAISCGTDRRCIFARSIPLP